MTHLLQYHPIFADWSHPQRPPANPITGVALYTPSPSLVSFNLNNPCSPYCFDRWPARAPSCRANRARIDETPRVLLTNKFVLAPFVQPPTEPLVMEIQPFIV